MEYNNVRYPGEVTNIKVEYIQVNVMVPAGKHTWKWLEHADFIFYQSKNILKKISPSETSSLDVSCFSF